jgi:putative Mg2+ transporter-C (MgtC) family protein
MHDLSQWEAIERIVVALAAGAILGLEREWTGKAAGVRTHALVAEGAALFMITSLMLGNQMRASDLAYDPSRIASTVVQGIGFISAGVIIRQQAQIKGLTTAAGLWVAAAVGLLVGSGFYVVAFAAVIATVITLAFLRPFEQELRKIEDSNVSPVRTRSPLIQRLRRSGRKPTGLS